MYRVKRVWKCNLWVWLLKFKIIEVGGSKNLKDRFEDAMNDFLETVAEIHDIVYEYDLQKCRASVTYTPLEENYGKQD